MKGIERFALAAGAALLLLGGMPTPGARETKDLQKQMDEIRGALPSFAIFIREVGDRFHASSGNHSRAADQGLGYKPRSEPGAVPK